MWFPNKHRRWLEILNLESRGIILLFLLSSKNKVSAKLFCSFVFAYAKCWFFHDVAQIIYYMHRLSD